MPKAVIASTLHSFDQSYALATVIINQARMIHRFSRIPVEIWVLDNCADDCPKDMAPFVKKCIPSYHWVQNDVNPQMIPSIQNVFQQGINEEARFFLCHDLVFQNSFVTYNEAIRRIAGVNDNVRWFHFTHSRPSIVPVYGRTRVQKLLHTLPANSKLVYMNYLDLNVAADSFNTIMSDCKVVYNAIEMPDLTQLNDPRALSIIEETKFDQAAVRVIYPFSTTRFTAKQVHYALELMSIFKQMKETVKFIGVNSHCNGPKEKKFIQATINKFTQAPYKLSKRDLFFTSELYPEHFSYSVPNETTIDLFKASNLFIFPTYSEVCPLVLLEAAATENLIVANKDVAPLIEMVGPAGAIFPRFGSIELNTRFADGSFKGRQDYFKAWAKYILPEINRGFYQTHAMHHVQKNFSLEGVWQKQLGPLLEV